MTLRLFVSLLLTAFTANLAMALDEQRMLDCADKPDAEQRLACYDALAQSISSSAAGNAPIPGTWRLNQVVNPETGALTLRLTTAAQNEIDSEAGPARPELSVLCENGKAKIALDWNIYLGQGNIRMRTDFDAIPHRVAVWSIADDFETVTSRGSDILLIKRMMRYDKLRADLTPFGGQPVFAEFTTSGLGDAIEPLRSACRI